jgi:thiol-disulfide isomerase/thioredoxin/uncharacterized membrane protein YphA (DoxX/SURF4 family)
MGLALVIARVGLACVFLLAGVSKLADLAGSRRAMTDFGVPERLAGAAAWLLPVCEVAVAVALVPARSARIGALGALILLALFVAGIGNALARGRTPDCHCFGQVHSAPAGWGTLMRNAGLLAVAGFVAIAGWNGGGDSATHWLGRVSAGWLAAIGVGVLLVAVVGFLAWFSLQLLGQNGRIFARLEAIEAAIGGPMQAAGAEAESALGEGLIGGGLAIGSPAPEFTLPSVDGAPLSLGSLLAAQTPLLLVFSDSGCGPCEALLPELAGWQAEHASRLAVAVVAGGDAQRNRAKAAEYGVQRMLLQSGREVSEAYQASGTPMALVVGADGLIKSPTVGGAEAIQALVTQATRRALIIRQVPASNGHHDEPAPPLPDTSQVGRPAPQLSLRDLDGELVALTDLYRRRTVAIFWNPGCGFCQRMLPELRALEIDPPEPAPQIVVISTGEPALVRELALRSRVLLDPDGEAMNAFSAGGTPMGVQIDQGRIASPVAAGAEAVFALIHAGAHDVEPGAGNGHGNAS